MIAIMLSALAIAPLTYANEAGSGYTDVDSLAPTVSSTIDADGKVVLSWDEATDADFKYYKVMWSQDNPDMVYPDDDYLAYIGEISTTTYTDSKFKTGTNYYRICTIVQENKRGCSNTLTLELTALDDTDGRTDDSKDEDSEDKADSGYTDDDTKAPTLSSEMSETGNVVLTWTQAEAEGFQYYKVLRSTDNPDMVYPEDGYITYITNVETLTYTDSEFEDGINYYRVCSIFKDQVRGCSNTLTLELSATDNKDEETSKDAQEDLSDDEIKYDDIKEHWAKAHIRRLAKKKIIDASKKAFRPDADITRAEAIKIIILSADLVADTCDADLFPDLSDDDWFCKVATKAYKQGYVKGNQGKLEPNKAITRAQAIKLVLLAKAVTVNTDVESVFPDVANGEWYVGYAVKAKALGIMQGKKGEDGKYYFDPNAPITRAELVKIIDKAFF